MSTTVVHVNEGVHEIYIGRANSRRGLEESRWANPNRISRELTREEAVNLYERWLRIQISTGRVDKTDLETLQGKRLGCWCKPELCHGDVLAWYADHADIVTMTDDELFSSIMHRGYDRALGPEGQWGKDRREALHCEFLNRIHPPGEAEWERMESAAINRAESRAFMQGLANGRSEGEGDNG